jgi:hypothetical protein
MQDILGQQKATDDQIKALDKLGLGFHQLKAMSPEEAFKVLAKAISGIPDQMERTATAIDFFGKGGMKIAAMAGDMDKFAKVAHDAGAVVDNDLIKSVAAFDDMIESSIQTVKSWGANVIGTIQKVAASAGKSIESGSEKGAFSKITSAGVLASNPALAGGLAAMTVGRVIGDAAGGSVDAISKKEADKAAADAQAENVKKAAVIEAAAAQDKREKDKLATSEITKKNKAALDGIEKARDADQQAGQDALDNWKKRLYAIKKVADAQKQMQYASIAMADRADESRRNREMLVLEKDQEKATKSLDLIVDNQAKVLGGVDAKSALSAARESSGDQRKRRKQIEDDARLRQIVEDRMAGRGGRISSSDIDRLKRMDDEMAKAKGFKNSADLKADTARKDAEKAQDAIEQRNAAKAAIESLQELKDARAALDKLVTNLKVAG